MSIFLSLLPSSLWWMKQSVQLETSSPKLCLRSDPSACPLMSSETSWRGYWDWWASSTPPGSAWRGERGRTWEECIKGLKRQKKGWIDEERVSPVGVIKLMSMIIICHLIQIVIFSSHLLLYISHCQKAIEPCIKTHIDVFISCTYVYMLHDCIYAVPLCSSVDLNESFTTNNSSDHGLL